MISNGRYVIVVAHKRAKVNTVQKMSTWLSNKFTGHSRYDLPQDSTLDTLETMNVWDFEKLPPIVQRERMNEVLEHLQTNGIPRNKIKLTNIARVTVPCLMAEDLQQILNTMNTNLGASQAPRTAPRVPTEVCINWISVLEDNLPKCPNSTSLLVKNILNEHKSRWMTHHLTIEEMRDALMDNSEELRRAGLFTLADVAYNRISTPSLYAQLPQSGDIKGMEEHYKITLPAKRVKYDQKTNTLKIEERAKTVKKDTAYYPLASRLSDNPYGAAFESYWMNDLIENPPNSLCRTMEVIAGGLYHTLADLEIHLRDETIAKLLKYLTTTDPRPWFEKVPRLQEVVSTSKGIPGVGALRAAWVRLSEVLKGNVNTGYEVVMIAYLTQKCCISYQSSLNERRLQHPQWLQIMGNNYSKNIESEQQQNGERPIHLMNPSDPRYGISNMHHPSPGGLGGSIDYRPVTSRRPKPSGGVSQVAMAHGLVYAGGVSGTTNIIMGMMAHFKKDLGLKIHTAEAVLATLMFVVYDGGHSMHEVLWTVYQRESTNKPYLSLGFKLKPAKSPLVGKFVPDYEQFITLYKGVPESQSALLLSCEVAWRKTLMYFKQHSYYASSFNIATPK